MVPDEEVQSEGPQSAHMALYRALPANKETSGRSRTASVSLGGYDFCHPGFGYPVAAPFTSTVPMLLIPPLPATILVCPELKTSGAFPASAPFVLVELFHGSSGI